MKVMALNSSPRGDGQSKTGMMLNSLVIERTLPVLEPFFIPTADHFFGQA